VGNHLLTAGIEGAFNDPILWGGDPNYWADTLRCDYTDRGVHFVIRDVSVFSINDYELESRMSGTPDKAVRIDKTRLTSNPICATILAREAPGNMSQEPTIQIKEVSMRVVCPIKRRRARLTHDGLLRLSAVLEELVKSKVAGGHSGGILMWDPPATEGRTDYIAVGADQILPITPFHSDWPPAPRSVSRRDCSDSVVKI